MPAQRRKIALLTGACAVVLPPNSQNRLVMRLLLLNSDLTVQIGITYTQRRGRIRMSDTPSHESGKNRGGVSRRSMLAGGVAAGAIGIGAATASGAMAAPRTQGPVVPPRKLQQTSMIGVPFEAHDEVRVGIIGLGNRGSGMTMLFDAVPGVRVTAICDVRENLVRDTSDRLAEAGSRRPREY